MNLLVKIQNYLKTKIDKVIEKISLHFVFILGVGLTSIIAKVFLKDFIIKKYFYTSWKKYLSNKDIRKMY